MGFARSRWALNYDAVGPFQTMDNFDLFVIKLFGKKQSSERRFGSWTVVDGNPPSNPGSKWAPLLFCAQRGAHHQGFGGLRKIAFRSFDRFLEIRDVIQQK